MQMASSSATAAALAAPAALLLLLLWSTNSRKERVHMTKLTGSTHFFLRQIPKKRIPITQY
jgi:hypothetical protein